MADPQLETLLKSVEALQNYQFKSVKDKTHAITALRKASSTMMSPYQSVMDIWGSGLQQAYLKAMSDLGLFSKWKQSGSDTKTVTQLAQLTDADPALLRSVLKHLAATHVLTETAQDTYHPTTFSLWLGEPHSSGFLNLYTYGFIPMFQHLPAYMRQARYQRPADRNWTPMSFGHHFPGTAFDFYAAHRVAGDALDNTMKSFSPFVGDWVSIYPVSELLSTAKEDGVALVDVAGGFGHDLSKLLPLLPPSFAPGRLVLQDQPHVLERASGLDPRITLMPHNFFTAQPVQGARAYFLHQILHDWPDEACLQILTHLKAAMEPGYSRILVCDRILAATGADWDATAMDVLMMTIFAAAERTEEEWASLAARAGLRIEKVWRAEGDNEAVLELVC